MLAEERRASNGRILPALELERHAQGGELAHGRMAEALDKLARGNVLVGEDLVDRADGALRHAGLIERARDVVARPRGDGGGEPRHHLFAAREPTAVGEELHVASPLLEPERAAERQPVLVARGDVEIAAVGAAEARGGTAPRMLGAG